MEYFRSTTTTQWKPEEAYLYYEKRYPGKNLSQIRFSIKKDLESLVEDSHIGIAASRWLARWNKIKDQFSPTTTDSNSENHESTPPASSSSGVSTVSAASSEMKKIINNVHGDMSIRDSFSFSGAKIISHNITSGSSSHDVPPKGFGEKPAEKTQNGKRVGEDDITREGKKARPISQDHYDEIDEFFNPQADDENDDSNEEFSLPALRDALREVDEINIGRSPRPEYSFQVDDKDIAVLFHDYKLRAKHILTEEKMFHETHLHELLGLTHILLLKPGEYAPLMLSVFGSQCLEKIRLEVLSNFCPSANQFDISILTELCRILSILTADYVPRLPSC